VVRVLENLEARATAKFRDDGPQQRQFRELVLLALKKQHGQVDSPQMRGAFEGRPANGMQGESEER
jgi:hypothetical protein